MTADLMWHEASTDHAARNNAERLSRAKVAAATVWPFLSLAKSPAEFDHRLALVADRFEETIPADLHEAVTASLREDFIAVTAEATPGPFGDGDDAVSHAQKATELYPDYRQLDPADPIQAERIKQRRLNQTQVGVDDEGDRRWDSLKSEGAWWNEGGSDHEGPSPDELDELHPSGGSMWDQEAHGDDHASVGHPAGWNATSAGGQVTIGHDATPGAVYDRLGGGPANGEEDLRDRLHGWVDQGHGRWAEHNVPSIRDHVRQLKTSSRAVTFWHEGARRWVTAAVDQGPPGEASNPYYFDGGPELGPNTFNTGQYPAHPTGGDPTDPINEQFPMTPSGWNNASGWETHDMHLMPGARNYAQGSRRQAADGWQDEGVQTGTGPNPHFFSGGEEGVQGGQDPAFPADPPITGNPDISVPPEETSEPLENERVNMYDHMDSAPVVPGPPGLGETTGMFSRMAQGLGSRHPFG